MTVSKLADGIGVTITLRILMFLNLPNWLWILAAFECVVILAMLLIRSPVVVWVIGLVADVLIFLPGAGVSVVLHLANEIEAGLYWDSPLFPGLLFTVACMAPVVITMVCRGLYLTRNRPDP